MILQFLNVELSPCGAKSPVRSTADTIFPAGKTMMAERPSSSSTLLSIQILRAVAALGVAIAHVGYGLGKLGVAAPDLHAGVAGVDLFFVISGFVMLYGSRNAFGQPGASRIFLVRRMIRIIPLYWIATSILVAYVLLTYKDLAAAGQTVGTIVASYLFVPWPPSYGPLLAQGWTLYFEMFFYTLFGISLLSGRRTIALVVLSATLLIFALIAPGFQLPSSLRYFANPILLEFVLGMGIAAAYVARRRLDPWVCYVLLGAGILAFAASAAFTLRQSLPRELIWGVPAALIVTGLVFAPTNFGPQSALRRLGNWLGFLGDASYSLYLFHIFFFTAPRLLFPGLMDAMRPWPVAVEILLIGLAVLGSCVIHVAIERPITRWLRRVTTSIPGAQPKIRIEQQAS